MPNVRIVTDSTCDLDPAYCAHHQVAVVPLNLLIDGQTYRDQIDISSAEFMRRLQATTSMPSTSQPSPAAFEAAYRAQGSAGDEVLAVLLSSKLSGTVQSGLLAASSVAPEIRVRVVDSLNATLGLGFQVMRAVELAAAGKTAAEVEANLVAETRAYHLVFFVDTLEYIQRGGRIGRAASIVGGVLQLKPLLRVDEGQVVPFERTRTRARAINGLIDFVQAFPAVARLGLLYSSEPSEADGLAAALAAVVPPSQLIRARFGPVLAAHVGPGALGVCVFEGPSQ